jgi:hypothetical protein
LTHDLHKHVMHAYKQIAHKHTQAGT